MNIRKKITNLPLFARILALLIILITVAYLSIVVTVWPQDYFWVERENATMPVWVRGNIKSNVFVIFNHGGPGSCGTLESIIEVNPGNGRMDHESPFKVLEDTYAMVYWDQRHACMSKGSADPNDSRPDDFGQDLAVVIDELEKRYDVQKIFIIGQSWGHTVAVNYLTAADDWRENQGKIDGYIIYKGNHDMAMPYEIVKPQILEYAQQQINNNTDAEHWQKVKTFYEERPTLKTASDFAEHGDYVFGVMGSSISLSDRILASVKASLFSPFNGLPVYPNPRQVWKDITTFIKHILAEFPQLPLFLGGHSSGAGLILNYASQPNHESIDNYIFLSPEFGFRSKTARPCLAASFATVNTLPFILNAMSGGLLSGHSCAVRFNNPGELLASDKGLASSYTINMANAMTPDAPHQQFAKIDRAFGLWIGVKTSHPVPLPRSVSETWPSLLSRDQVSEKVMFTNK